MINRGDVVSHLEMETSVSPGMVWVRGRGAVFEDFIARSSASFAAACFQSDGLIRNAACVSRGFKSAALGGGAVISAADLTPELRNVTATATGTFSSGLSYNVFGDAKLTLDAKGVIAKGAETDVVAGAFSQSPNTPGTGADVRISLDHSDYETVLTESDNVAGGTATITPAAGIGTNILEPPLLAPDGFHQIEGSPTIDHGPEDAGPEELDIDGDQRFFGDAPDIGADEFVVPSSQLTVACEPSALENLVGSEATCTATVVGPPDVGQAPSGTVVFTTDSINAFSENGRCDLQAVDLVKSSCGVTYSAAQVSAGAHQIKAQYFGDPRHTRSNGTATVTVTSHDQGGGGGPGPGGGPKPVERPPGRQPAPNTRIQKHPRKRTSRHGVRFFFVSNQADASFECKLDKRPFRPCTSPFKARVKAGRHTFQVRAVGALGTRDPTPAIFRWRVNRLR